MYTHKKKNNETHSREAASSLGGRQTSIRIWPSTEKARVQRTAIPKDLNQAGQSKLNRSTWRPDTTPSLAPVQRRGFHSPKEESLKNDVVQRVIRISGSQDQFIRTKEELEALGIKPTPELNALVTDSKLYGFLSIEELQELAPLMHSCPEIMAILQSPLFLSASREPLVQKFKVWALKEFSELVLTIKDEEIKESCAKLWQHLKNKTNMKEMAPLLKEIHERLTAFQLDMFSLDAERNPKLADGEGDVYKGKKGRCYGYHLTKLHNLSGIARSGLSPREGASDRGSVAASTDDQKTGSIKTSTNVVAFGMHPHIFRTYINQFEDRRRLIEGAPIELKPVMLRFRIRPDVRDSAIEFQKKGGDYMDAAARNTGVPISPEDIDVLTPDGWVPIQIYIASYTPETDLYEMRSEAEGDKGPQETDGHWDETMVLKWDDPAMEPISKEIEKQVASTTPSYIDSVRIIKGLIGTEFRTKNGKVIFRGATLQTSGQFHSWEYILSIVSRPNKDPDRWMRDALLKYDTDYRGRSRSQIENFHKELPEGASGSTGSAKASGKGRKVKASGKGRKARADAEGRSSASESKSEARGGASMGHFPTYDEAWLNTYFTRGYSPGTNLNCLLYTMWQLQKKVKIEGEDSALDERIVEIRGVLAALGLVLEDGMIDIYGGVGMQLANDLNLQIQVIQETAPGQYIVHPIIGQTGPLVRILHSGEHFTPLWPK